MSIFFDVEDDFNFDIERQGLLDNLSYLMNMSVQEQTLYKKWNECQQYKSKNDSNKNTSFKIWQPKNILDIDSTLREIEDLKPKLLLVENEYQETDWLNLRIFSHSMSWDANPGRLIKLLVIDENTDKFLGISSIASDVTALTPRDKIIGWTMDDRFAKKKINHTCIATTICATQPFGYNFLGTKLIASLLTTNFIRDLWEKMYDNVLVGMTTTSLYGQGSVYNSIPWWKSIGESEGKIITKPDDYVYDKWHMWLKENDSIEYERHILKTDDEGNRINVTSPKQKIIKMIFKHLGIKEKDFIHGYHRGVYFSPFYTNFREFLTDKITKDELILNPKMSNDVKGVIDWWKIKAINRYKKLHSENKIKAEKLYYSDVPFMTWEQTKEKYLSDIGR